MLPELETAVAARLLSSTIPARLAFVGESGQPHVTPIWFLWRDGAIVMCSFANSAKVRAIKTNPRIALTIDSEEPPYQVLRIRGSADIEIVDGILDEYVTCAHRYYGKKLGSKWIAGLRGVDTQMARITVVPDWAEAADFEERFPHLYRDENLS